ncbi:unnamed protein product, partial [marine sediment metagenome]
MRGFVGQSGAFFVYDKRTGKMFETSPGAAFFENDLNTVIFPDGRPSDSLEALYTEMETHAWPSLGVIRESSADAPIAMWDKIELFLFLSFLHWRLPANASYAQELAGRSFDRSNDLAFFKIVTATGEAPPQDIVEQIRTSAAWQKAVRAVVPFAPFYPGNTWFHDLANWRFLYPADAGLGWIVGDN